MKGKQALLSATRRVFDLGVVVERLTDQLQSEKKARTQAEKRAMDRDTLAREVSRLRVLNEEGSSDALVAAEKDRDSAARGTRNVLSALAKRDDFIDAAMKVIRRGKGLRGAEAIEAILTELRGKDTKILFDSPKADPGNRHTAAIERKRRKKAMRSIYSPPRPGR